MGLRAFSFQDPTLELFLTRVRSELLNYYYENREINFLKSFIFSLAKQCFLNEYVYIVYKRDKEIISKLKERLIISKKIDEGEMFLSLDIKPNFEDTPDYWETDLENLFTSPKK